MAGAKKSARDEPPAVHLRAPSGHLIRFTLPLHEAIATQWRNGELQRVQEDGSPFEGDQYDLSALLEGSPGEAAAPAASAAPVPAGPARPAESAPLKAWQDYAVAVGACTAAEAVAMTRPDLVAKCTPPEMQPATLKG
jgi:hypothetical protein